MKTINTPMSAAARRTSKNVTIGILMAVLFLLFRVTTASAVPFFTAVDLDPLTPGVQSTLTVDPGDVFTVDVVLGEIGGPYGLAFDEVLLDVLFNDMGTVLGLVPGMPVAGALAGLPLTLDAAISIPLMVVPGSPLFIGPSFALGPPFTSSLGGVGLFNPTPFVFVGPGPVSVFSVSFTALAPGTSSSFAPGALPGSELTIGNAGPGTFPFLAAPVGAPILLSGTITVTPEPSTMLLLGFGLAGLGFFRRRKKAA